MKEFLRKKKNAKGFTLIELLVVVAIIAILGTVIAVNLMDKTSDAKVASANTNAQSIHSAVNIYLQEQVIEGDAVPNGFYESEGTLPSGMADAIGTNVSGYWALQINDDGVAFVLWSDTDRFTATPAGSPTQISVSGVTGLTAATGPVDADVIEAAKGTVGCYPLS